MSLDPRLLELLACPVCHGDLVLHPDDRGLECPACRLLYPVRDGIPIMLEDEARPTGPDPEIG